MQRDKLNLIYVVDDNLEMCRSLEALLGTYGHQIRTYTNPLQFLEDAHDLEGGLVLLDLRMKEANGLEVLERLRGQGGRLPVIIITGHGDVALAVQAMKLGAIDFIEKPFREDTLVTKIERELLVLEQNRPANRLLHSLTSRERQVAEALAQGLSNKQVADQLGLSVRTVEMHRSRGMQRLGCRSFADYLRAIIAAQA